MEEEKRKKKGGLEFLPLREGKTEEFYRVLRGRRHPKQLCAFGKAEDVGPDGKKRG